MAINYPGISYLRGYETNPDIVGRFGQGYDLGRGIRAEQDAPDVFAAYLDSLGVGPQQRAVGTALSIPGTDEAMRNEQTVMGSHQAALGATDPALDAYFRNTQRAESGGNDAARNPNSTATGRYQFIEGTWNDLAKRHPDLGLTPEGRTDPAQQERAMRAFTAENARTLSQRGLQVNPGTLYAAHFLGPQGAASVLAMPDETPMLTAAGPEVVKANPFLADMSVGQFKEWAGRKGGGAGGGYQGPTVDPVTTGGIGQAPMGVQQQAQLPPRDVMLALFRNPVTRQLAIDAIQRSQAGADGLKPTSDMTEYMFALSQGYGGTFQQYQTDMKRAGATNVNVGAGEKAWDTESAKLFAKRYDDLTTQAQTAQEMLGFFDAAEQAFGSGVNTGLFGETELTLRRMASAMGIPDADNAEKVAAGELIKSIQNRMSLIMRSPDSGMGMPGAVSDRDLIFLKDAQIGIDRSPEGNRKMLQAFSALERRKVEIAALADQYIEANGRLDPGFNRVVREYAEANPLFDKLFGADSGARPISSDEEYDALPSGAEFIDPEGNRRRKP